MYQQYINEARAAQQQQDYLREAAVERNRYAVPDAAHPEQDANPPASRSFDPAYLLRAFLAAARQRLPER